MMERKKKDRGNKKKILVAIANYPDTMGLNNGKSEAKFEHVRNKFYLAHGQDVTVLNFAASRGYSYDGIRVVTLS